MFGFKRKRRFEAAVQAEMSYLLAVHGTPSAAAEAGLQRAARETIGAGRAAIIAEAARRLALSAATEASR